MADDGAAGTGYRDLSPAERAREPYLHVDPCYLNIAKCMRVFGGYFKDFYNRNCIKEETEYARIFNHHLLVTYAMDACRDRKVATLGEALADPRPAALFCSVHDLAGTEDVLDARVRVAENRIVLPFAARRAVRLRFETYNFLSRIEREDQARPVRLAVLAQIDIVEDGRLVAAPLFMGTPTFDHFRNEADMLARSGLAGEWFEVLPGDIERIEETAPPAGGEHGPGIRFFAATLAGRTVGAALLGGLAPAGAPLTADALGTDAGILARLAATPAGLLALLHDGPVEDAVGQALRAFAVAPHAPRRYCIIGGAEARRLGLAGDN